MDNHTKHTTCEHHNLPRGWHAEAIVAVCLILVAVCSDRLRYVCMPGDPGDPRPKSGQNPNQNITQNVLEHKVSTREQGPRSRPSAPGSIERLSGGTGEPQRRRPTAGPEPKMTDVRPIFAHLLALPALPGQPAAGRRHWPEDSKSATVHPKGTKWSVRK